MVTNDDKSGTKKSGRVKGAIHFNTCFKYDSVIRSICKDVGADTLTTWYLRKRTSIEGLPFLMTALPSFEKSVVSYIEDGTDFYSGISFKKTKYVKQVRKWIRSGTRAEDVGLYPFGCFLEPLKKGLREANHEAVADSLFKIRSICSYFYKLAIVTSNEKRDKALINWLSCEADLSSDNFLTLQSDIKGIRKLAIKLYPELFNTTLDSVLKVCPPRFTSGSYVGNRPFNNLPPSAVKRVQRRYLGFTNSGPDYEGLTGFLKPHPSYKVPRYSNRNTPLGYDELLFVNKDARGPRSITKCDLFSLPYQMSYFDFMVKTLEYKSGKRINFLDQGINRKLAFKSSITKEFSTLDLKDASDRVIFHLVSQIFEGSFMVSFFNKFRNTRIKLPASASKIFELLLNVLDPEKFIWLLEKLEVHSVDETLYNEPLKLAGMGSGFTFPTMSLLIQLVTIYEVNKQTRVPIHELRKRVYVYGDDLIIPSEYRPIVESVFPKWGLRINFNKSFSKSFFRESCGGDYYYGYDVTPLRLKLTNNALEVGGVTCKQAKKKTLPLIGVECLLELERHCRELMRKGFVTTANYFYTVIENAVGQIPWGSRDTPYLCRYVPASGVTDLILDTFYKYDHDSKVRVIQVSSETGMYPRDRRGRSVHCESALLGDALRTSLVDKYSIESNGRHEIYTHQRLQRAKKKAVSPIELYGYTTVSQIEFSRSHTLLASRPFCRV